MAQPTNTDVQAKSATAAQGFFAAIRSSLKIDALQGKIFSDLLSQTAVSTTPPPAAPVTPARDQADKRADDKDAHEDRRAAAILANSSDDDRAALRSMLQKIKQDKEELHASRQRDRANKVEDNKADAAEAPVVVKDKSEVKKATNQDDACAEKTDDKSATVEDAAAASDETDVKADSTTTKAGDESKIVATDKTDTSKATQEIAADLTQTEQAVVLLLNKILQNQKETPKGDSAEVSVAAQSKTDDAALASLANVTNTDTGKAKHEAGSKMAAAPVLTADQATPAATLNADAGQDRGDAMPGQSGQKQAGEAVKSSLVTANQNQPKAESHFEFLNLFNVNNVANSNAPAATAAVVKGAGAEQIGADAAAKTSTATTPTNNLLLAEGNKPVGSYDFASQLSATRATKGGATGLPSVVEQVALQLHRQVKDGQDQMTLQLRPNELGRIEIKLTFGSDNKVHGTVVADNLATLDMLLKDVGGLQRALQDAGLRADPGSLQFSLRGEGQPGFGQSQNSGNQEQSNSNGTASGYGLNQLDEGSDIAASAEAETYYLTPGRVNLRV